MAAKQKSKPDNKNTPGLSLFKIDEEMAVIRIMLDEAGELSEADDAYYCQLIEMAKKKCDGYIGSIGYIESQVEIGKAHIKLMQKRLKRWENISDRLRDNLAVFMSNNRIQKLTPENPVLPCAYLNKGKVKLDIEAEKLPPEYVTETVVKSPNKEAIQKAVDDNIAVPGVTVTAGDDYIRLS